MELWRKNSIFNHLIARKVACSAVDDAIIVGCCNNFSFLYFFFLRLEFCRLFVFPFYMTIECVVCTKDAHFRRLFDSSRSTVKFHTTETTEHKKSISFHLSSSVDELRANKIVGWYDDEVRERCRGRNSEKSWFLWMNFPIWMEYIENWGLRGILLSRAKHEKTEETNKKHSKVDWGLRNEIKYWTSIFVVIRQRVWLDEMNPKLQRNVRRKWDEWERAKRLA